MTSTLKITLKDIKMPLVGMNGIDIFVDGNKQAEIRFGETVVLEVVAGERKIQTRLRGLLDRRSKMLPVTIAEGEPVIIMARYSRMWGNIKLKRV